MNDENYIKQLREILDKTGWSQTELASRLGVTFASLNRWLNQKNFPHPSSKKIINALYKETVGILPIEQEELDKLIAQVEEQKNKYQNLKNIIKENKNLREALLLELTYNSNAIEGSTLTKHETEAIIFDHAIIKDKTYIEQLEATNHARALEKIFEGDFGEEISEETIKRLHEIVLQGIRPDAGKYATLHRGIRGVNLILPAPEDIPEQMSLLVKQINQQGNRIIAQAAKTHADFEAIHPFGDGNGRVGRLIMVIQLLNNDYAPCLINRNSKAEYYEALEYAQKKSETQLIKFIAENILNTYQIISACSSIG